MMQRSASKVMASRKCVTELHTAAVTEGASVKSRGIPDHVHACLHKANVGAWCGDAIDEHIRKAMDVHADADADAH